MKDANLQSLKRLLTRHVSLTWQIFGVAAALRVASFLTFYLVSMLSGHGGHVDPYDPVGIDRWAWYAAQHFARGQWVDLSASSLEGTWTTGFTYFVAVQYLLFGHHSEIPRFVNTLLAAFTAPATYMAARATPLGETVAKRAGWLVAIWPLSIYWAGYDLLKDPMVWFFLSLSMLAIVSRSTLRFALFSAASATPMLLFRIYIGAGLYVFLPLSAALQRRWRVLVATVGVLAVGEGALLVAGYPALWSSAYLGDPQAIVVQTAAPAPIDLSTGANDNLNPAGQVATAAPSRAQASPCSSRSILQSLFGCNLTQAVGRLLVGLLINVLGPRPALKDIAHPTLDTGMYPGLLMWILLIPFVVLGFWRAAKLRNAQVISLVILGVGLWIGIAFLISNGGFRQREMAFPVTLVFASLGLERPLPKHWNEIYGLYLVVGVTGLLIRQFGFL